MAWHHVADEDGHCSRCNDHSIWRCGNCRALCVTQKGQQPYGKCLKCQSKDR